ncbi:MAG: hypothetical protein ACRD0K_08145 [Egibacteraceae bacterium]
MRESWPVRYCRCGTRLARDNPDTRCAPCQRKDRDRELRPPVVPAEFWDTDQMRDALANRHMGGVVEAYRHHPFHGLPLSQELVGGWLGITQGQLSRIEHGPPIRDLDKLTRWAQILRVPGRCLWFDLPGQRRDAAQPAPAPDVGPPDQLSDRETVPDGDAMMVWLVTTIEGKTALVPLRLSRRTVLAAGGASLAAALAGLLDPDELARVKAAVIQPNRADMATVGHLEALLGHYRRLEDAFGPRRLLGPVKTSLDLVDHLRRDAQPPVRQALLSLAGQYQQLAGWLWTDSGDHAMGERAYDNALARAAEHGDQPLAGYVLACRSLQHSLEGRADTAVALAQTAQQGERRLTPAVHAYAAMLEAQGWAVKGEPAACERKLDEAGGLLAASVEQGRAEEPPWIYWFGVETLAARRGVCLTDLGRAAEAIEVFADALPALPDKLVRDRAYHLIWLARAYGADDDPEQAGAVALQAARIAVDTGSDRILEQLGGLYGELAVSAKDVHAVRELGDLLRSGGVVGNE